MVVFFVIVVVAIISLAVASDLRDRRTRGRVPRVNNISAELRERRAVARARRTIFYRSTEDE